MIVEMLRNFLGSDVKHSHSKGQINFDCPRCSSFKSEYEGDGKGNLEVNYIKGVFQCWACADEGTHGSIWKLIRLFGNHKHKSQYKKWLDEYASELDYDWYDKNYKSTFLALPKGYKPIRSYDSKIVKEIHAINYLKSRNISLDIVKRHRIGYCAYGKYINRIIFPSYDSGNNLNFFVGRDFTEKRFDKYKNEDIKRTEIVFNEYLLNFDSTIYIVEGPTDHIVVPNSVPLLGKYVPDKLHMRLYKEANAEVIIFLDGDAFNKARGIYDELNSGRLSGRVRIIDTPKKYDPSKLNKSFGPRGVIKVIQNAGFVKID